MDRDILEQALRLLKEMVHLGTKAAVFLELQGVSGINTAITNQRDALSHLVLLLTASTRSDQLSQVVRMKEHLRRAITEPYDLAFEIARERVETLLERSAHSRDLLSSAAVTSDVSDTASLRQRLDSILRRVFQARSKVEEPDWEARALLTIEAFTELEALRRTLEGTTSLDGSTEDSNEQHDDTVGGIPATAAGSEALVDQGGLFAALKEEFQREAAVVNRLISEVHSSNTEAKRYSLRMMIWGAVVSALLGVLLGTVVAVVLDSRALKKTPPVPRPTPSPFETAGQSRA